MESMNGLARIRGAYTTLGKKEQRIADYILKQPERIALYFSFVGPR